MDPKRQGEAPTPDADALLHAAASEELAETRTSVAKARKTARYRVGAAVNAWMSLVNAPPIETSPTMKAIIRAIVDEPASTAVRSTVPATARDSSGFATVANTQKAEKEPTHEASRAPTQAQTSRPAASEASPAASRAQPSGSQLPDAVVPPRSSTGGRATPSTTAPTTAARVAKKPAFEIFSQPGLSLTNFGIPTIEAMTGSINARLAEASHIVGRLIAGVKASSDDPDVRMANLEALNKAMSEMALANSRERKREAAELARQRAEKAGLAQSAPAPALRPAQMNLFEAPVEAPIRPVTPHSAPTAPVREPSAESRPSSVTEARALENKPSPALPPADAPKVPPETETKPLPESPPLREDPADAKRRRRREEEEKAERRRRAVLAKRNRGRGR